METSCKNMRIHYTTVAYGSTQSLYSQCSSNFVVSKHTYVHDHNDHSKHNTHKHKYVELLTRGSHNSSDQLQVIALHIFYNIT